VAGRVAKRNGCTAALVGALLAFGPHTPAGAACGGVVRAAPTRDLPGRAPLRAAGRRHPERVVVLDWVAYSAGHPSWFAPDGLHLGPGGAEGLARLLERGFLEANPLRARFRSLPQRRRGAEAFDWSRGPRNRPPRRGRASAWPRSMAATTSSAAIEAPAGVRCTPSGWRTVTRRPR